MNIVIRTFAERGVALVTGIVGGAIVNYLGYDLVLALGLDPAAGYFLTQLGLLGVAGFVAAAMPRVPATLRWMALGLALWSAGAFALSVFAPAIPGISW